MDDMHDGNGGSRPPKDDKVRRRRLEEDFLVGQVSALMAEAGQVGYLAECGEELIFRFARCHSADLSVKVRHDLCNVAHGLRAESKGLH